MSGCYGRNCEGEAITFGTRAGEGSMINADTWQSNPIEGTWLEFPRQRVWIFDMRELGDRIPAVPMVYVSAQASPNTESGGNFTAGAGNIAEVSGVLPGRMTVRNGTCSDYYVRVTAMATPRPPAATPTSSPADAGPDADAAP